MAASRRAVRPRFALFVLVLAAITVLTLYYKGGAGTIGSLRSKASDLVNPVDSAVKRVVRPVGDFFQGATSYSSLRAEVGRLQTEVTKLKAQAAAGGTAEAQLSSLASLDHLKFAANMSKIAAGVVGSVSSNFEQSIVVDKGSTAGVAVGMPVVSGTGLVGRVTQVSHRTSTVLLLTDPTFAAGVSFGSKGYLGVASGQGAGKLMDVQYVSPKSHIHVGELGETAEVKDGNLPLGIPVGKVVSVKDPTGALQESITMRPLTNLGDLQFVDIIRWTPSSP